MPIETFIDQDLDNVIVVRFIGVWDWNDYQSTLDQVKVIVDSEIEKYYEITDLSETRHIPRGAPSPHLNRGRRIGDPILLVVVGEQAYISLLWRTLGISFNPKSPNLVQTLDEARTRIRNHQKDAAESASDE